MLVYTRETGRWWVVVDDGRLCCEVSVSQCQGQAAGQFGKSLWKFPPVFFTVDLNHELLSFVICQPFCQTVSRHARE